MCKEKDSSTGIGTGASMSMVVLECVLWKNNVSEIESLALSFPEGVVFFGVVTRHVFRFSLSEGDPGPEEKVDADSGAVGVAEVSSEDERGSKRAKRLGLGREDMFERAW